MATKKRQAPTPSRKKSKAAGKFAGTPRPRGRPANFARPLSRPAVLAAARKQLERNGLQGFTMRALAARMRVDPMALYHYFPDRESLLREASLDYYRSFHVDFRGRPSWKTRLGHLAETYLDFLAGAVDVLIFLTADEAGGAAAAGLLDPFFAEATRGLDLSGARRRDFSNLFFDFLHGAALARLGGAEKRIWRGELRFLIAGVEALQGS